MDVLLRRYFENNICTLGIISVEGMNHAPIYTLELPYRGNSRSTSCIPEGVYPLSCYSSERFQNALLISDVQNRDGILIHRGNYLKDTQGCILPGTGVETIKPEPIVTNSAVALNTLLEILKKDKHTLTVMAVQAIIR